MGFVFQGFENGFEACFKVASVFGAGQQSAHIQRIDHGFGQNLGHRALGDAPSQAFGNSGLAHTRLAHQKWVVFAAAAKDLNHALDFKIAPDQRIYLAFFGALVQVDGVLI